MTCVDYIGKQSLHLLSECCDAPLLLTYEPMPDRYNVHCGACLSMVGRPGGEDMWDLGRGELPPTPWL